MKKKKFIGPHPMEIFAICNRDYYFHVIILKKKKSLDCEAFIVLVIRDVRSSRIAGKQLT